jgi:ubiquinone biosynthesis protein
MSWLSVPVHMSRLARAGVALARAGLPRTLGISDALPQPVRRLAGWLEAEGNGDIDQLSHKLVGLGPAYIKLGQFLATRPDIIGLEGAGALARLHDRLDAFAQSDAEAEVERAFGKAISEVYAAFGPSVAAASIAQVHRAEVTGGPVAGPVAVKILRPGVEHRFARDLAGFYFAARAAEFVSAPARRLRPVEAVATLERSVELEMDLRLEAAAISEMAENMAEHPEFRVPLVDWGRTSRRVLTTEWIDGIGLGEDGALAASGHDLRRLARVLIQMLLSQALDHGFFHADMHPGNLFVDDDGRLVAVDFGIMGRLGPKERRFLAEILWGFITRDYRRTSEVHFEAGYVPARHTSAEFAQALRAIGEPLAGRRAEEISMAQLLTQLFEVTRQFDMAMRPELLLLQKTMVVTEGVARQLDPELDMWSTAEPVVGAWLERRLSPEGRMRDAAEGAASLGRLVEGLPALFEGAERVASAFAAAQRGDPETARVKQREGVPRALWWIIAAALVVIALG